MTRERSFLHMIMHGVNHRKLQAKKIRLETKRRNYPKLAPDYKVGRASFDPVITVNSQRNAALLINLAVSSCEIL